jgi:hypothetical protein
MTLSRTERFKLKSGVLDAMDDDRTWNFQRRNLLLGEFGFPALEGYNDAPGFEDVISAISDSDLIEMYALVTGVEVGDVQDTVNDIEPGSWKSGYVRLFLSHSARHKQFAGAVADELAVVGIHAFVAHDSMEYSRPWQEQIEGALRSMNAFVALIHPEFLDSPWCQQEVGWALGSRVPRFFVRINGTDPTGFIGRDQWPSGSDASARGAADVISTWASSVPDMGDVMISGLFAALESANNYMDAGATARRIASLNALTESQWDRLAKIYWANDQVRGGSLPSRALQPFYEGHNRTWPPSSISTETTASSASQGTV